MRILFIFMMGVLLACPVLAMADTGDLQISCESGVRIFVDGDFVDITNDFDNGLFVEGLSPGTHVVKAIKKGFQPFEKSVNIKSQKAEHLKIVFKNVSEEIVKLDADVSSTVSKVGNIELRSAPLGATVYVDGQKKGSTDILVKNVGIGEHNIKFEKNKKILTGVFSVHEGETTKLKAHFRDGVIYEIDKIDQHQSKNTGAGLGGETYSDKIKDCDACPEVIRIRSGAYHPTEKMEACGAKPCGWIVPEDLVLYLGRYEVTRDEYEYFLRDSGHISSKGCFDVKTKEVNSGFSYVNPGYSQNGNHPVTCVSWNDITSYLSWLSKKTKHEYMLPYLHSYSAALVGHNMDLVLDEKNPKICKLGNMKNNNRMCNDRYSYTSPVGTFQASNSGNYDVIGNADEATHRYKTDDGGYAIGILNSSYDSEDLNISFLDGAGRKDNGFGYNNLGFRVLLVYRRSTN